MHRRNVLLINKNFQLRYSFYVVSWIVTLSLVYPFITNNLFEFFLTYIQQHSPGVPFEAIVTLKKEFLQLLIFFQIVFVAVIFLISLFMSHKIAGPIYKLKKHMEEAKNGNLETECHFRKADYFQDLANDFNDLLKSFRNKLNQK